MINPIKNFSLLFGENFFKLLLGAFTSFFIARRLSPEGYGELSYVLSFSSLLIPVFTMGSDDWFLGKFTVNKDPEDITQKLSESIYIRLIGSFLGIFLSLMAISIFGKNPNLSRLIILLNIFYSLKTFDTFAIFLNSQEKVSSQSKARLVTYIITNLSKVLIAVCRPEFTLVVYISCLELALFALGYWVSFKKEGYSFYFARFNPDHIKKILVTCSPLVALSFVNIGLTKIDQIMLGNLSSAEVLGKYSAVVKLMELWQFLPIVLTTVFIPRIIKYNSKECEYTSQKGAFFIIILISSVLLSLATYIISEPLILTLFGSKYFESISILRTYLWQSILFFTFLSKQKFLIAESKVFLSFLYAAIALISNIILNLILIPPYGVSGAIIASISCIIISEVFLTITSSDFRKDNGAIIMGLNITKSYNQFKKLL
jgi:PST family polysaccharide transporter